MSRCSILQTSVSTTNRSARLARTWSTDEKIFSPNTNKFTECSSVRQRSCETRHSFRTLAERSEAFLTEHHAFGCVLQLGKSSLVFVLLLHRPTSRITARH